MERETRAAAEQRPAQRVAALVLYSELPGQARHWDREDDRTGHHYYGGMNIIQQQTKT